MLKILCRALGHRCRVVQEFTPVTRRVKCVWCGGDWAMNDANKTMMEWGPRFEQVGRDFGFEILEPVPAWCSFPVEPLTLREMLRACRWPGALAITLSSIVGYTMEAAGGGTVGLIAVYAFSWAAGRFLAQRAIDRAYERKCKSLQA